MSPGSPDAVFKIAGGGRPGNGGQGQAEIAPHASVGGDGGAQLVSRRLGLERETTGGLR